MHDDHCHQQKHEIMSTCALPGQDGASYSPNNLVGKLHTGGWKAAPLIFVTEICERMATLGLQRNLVTYLVNKMHFSIPRSANMVSNFVGALYLTAFIGGFVADSYTGRFWAITIFSSIQICGMVLLTLSATLPVLRPPECSSHQESPCHPATGLQRAVLLSGLYVIALGNGGIKPNVSSMGADQFDEKDPERQNHMSHFFNSFYFIISIGSLLSVTVFVYLQDNLGFGWGFGIPALLMSFGIVIFFAGAPLYRHKVPRGSALTSVAQVLFAAVRKRNLPYPSDGTLLFDGSNDNKLVRIAHTNQFLFLDKAAIYSGDEDAEECKDPWWLCTVTQVEEFKMIIRMLPIWASTVFVWTALAQMETFSVEQGATMKRNVGPLQFPPASLSVFELVTVLLLLPVYDRYFVPCVRQCTGYEQGITCLQRIGVGIIFSVFCMVIAGFVEILRVKEARDYGLLDKPNEIIPMSIFWLVPQYFLTGITEIFTQIGQLEFFYRESPNHMQGLGTALYVSTIGIGHFLSSFIVSAVNTLTRHGDYPGWLENNLNVSRLDYFYWLLAMLSLLNFAIYVYCAQHYRPNKR
ncbi:hypothetical protein O6H91_13G090300 [Diphasiastrum complanatum]|uniref:Uncharacterized protein n=1 Tax=Diphasiastrum complanatum TaxID=34168 RepID=A0ACC2BX54_DIPCM|nr:hypothetical protein O6H91_13G090300 [Diphasiastrum complanatum]